MTGDWNTNEIGMLDERVASPGFQTYHFPLPGTVSNGLFTLSFRLDAYNNTASSVAVTNVTTGFAGTQQPINLQLLTGGNSAPLLQLTAASNFNYLVESSTNLLDWIPTALLINSNGTVLFADPTATNLPQQFYRAQFK